MAGPRAWQTHPVPGTGGRVAGSFDDLAADLRALLLGVPAKGLPLTGTGRLRLADVRTINARLAAPAPLDHDVGGRTFPLRREDEAARVHFLRLLAEAGELIETRPGHLSLTERGREIAGGAALDAARLFADWWWRGAWDAMSTAFYEARGPEEDRAFSARELHARGQVETSLRQLGQRFLRRFGAPAPVHEDLHVDMWARAVWRACLEPLAAFGGCVGIVEHHRVEPLSPKGSPMEYDETVAVRLTPEGLALLHAAIAGERPAERRSAIPDTRAAVGRPSPRVTLAHPDLADAAARGDIEARTHLLLHQGLEEMRESGDVPAANEVYARLVASGRHPHEVEHLLAEAVTREVMEHQREGRPFDPARFAARLSDMADEWLREDQAGALAGIDERTLGRMRGLPRSEEVWEGAVRSLREEMVLGTGWASAAVWVTTDGALPRGIEPRDADDVTALLRGFVDAALHPGPGFRPEIPARLRLSDATSAAALRHALAPLGISVEVAPRLPSLDLLLETVASFVGTSAITFAPRARRSRRRPRRGR